ncbi:hypothetical protein KSP40_PGU008324 [Platanthera guangdongensis]|uniref:Uncharacterized protein n=1 Tax=Platanthera guangdongensis TaxID=2320717 RepID=A0ABR2MJY1_9ASPA
MPHVETIYVTIWASPSISLHLRKIDTADELRSKHFGIRLQRPIGQDKATELGEWRAREFKVSGTSWYVNSVDKSASGPDGSLWTKMSSHRDNLDL